jgi:polyhydroxybutyrate depolymerase
MKMRSRIAVVSILIAGLSLVPALGLEPDPTPEPAPVMSEERQLDHDGIQRSYRIYVPESYDDAIPTPLVLALHGGRGTGRSMERLTGFSLLADSEGFIVVYPDGYERQWNDGRNIERYASHRENIDDVGFINSLIDHLTQTLNIDADRVYLTGMSNGALFSHRLACENPDRIAAIAPVEGTILERWTRECQPTRPVPVCIVKGPDAPLFEKESKRLSASETAQFWASHNGCKPAPTVTYETDSDPADGTRVRSEAYDCGSREREVVFYAIEGGGHTWPGGWQYYPEDLIGRTSRDIDATRVIWEFFEGHAKPGARSSEHVIVERIDHVTVAVRDLDAAKTLYGNLTGREFFADLLGSRFPEPHSRDGGRTELSVDGLGIELIASTLPDSWVNRFIDGRKGGGATGEGVAYVSMKVDSYEEAHSALVARGYREVATTKLPTRKVALLVREEGPGIGFEIIEYRPLAHRLVAQEMLASLTNQPD